MRWEEPDPRKSFGLNKRELSWFLGVQPPMEVLALRNYVQKHWGKRWDLPFCMDFRNLWGCQLSAMEVLRFLKRFRLDPERFLRYLDRVCEETEGHYATLFELYRDYLDAAWALGYCMEHGKVLWPENLSEAHDTATAELARKQAAALRREIAADARSRKDKYEFELDGLRIVFPMTSGAIKREGKALDHCVGGYAERHMKGVTTILFLRRTEAPATPYITLEMNGNTIRQIHGYHNDTLPGSKDPRAAHGTFLNIWLRWLRDGSKRDESGAPRLPKRRETARTA